MENWKLKQDTVIVLDIYFELLVTLGRTSSNKISNCTPQRDLSAHHTTFRGKFCSWLKWLCWLMRYTVHRYLWTWTNCGPVCCQGTSCSSAVTAHSTTSQCSHYCGPRKSEKGTVKHGAIWNSCCKARHTWWYLTWLLSSIYLM